MVEDLVPELIIKYMQGLLTSPYAIAEDSVLEHDNKVFFLGSTRMR